MHIARKIRVPIAIYMGNIYSHALHLSKYAFFSPSCVHALIMHEYPHSSRPSRAVTAECNRCLGDIIMLDTYTCLRAKVNTVLRLLASFPPYVTLLCLVSPRQYLPTFPFLSVKHESPLSMFTGGTSLATHFAPALSLSLSFPLQEY